MNGEDDNRSAAQANSSVTAFPRWSHHFFTNVIMRRDPDLEEKRDRRITLTP